MRRFSCIYFIQENVILQRNIKHGLNLLGDRKRDQAHWQCTSIEKEEVHIHFFLSTYSVQNCPHDVFSICIG